MPASATCTRAESLSPERGVMVRVNATSRPSGEKARGEAERLVARLKPPLVTRRAGPPSAGTIQRCDGRGAARSR